MAHKYRKLIAISLGVILVAQILVLSVGQIQSKGNSPVALAKDVNEERIAAELSNMSGVKVEQILALKHSGKTWNQVIDTLKAQSVNNPQSGAGTDKLAETGMDETYMKKLTEEGFTNDQIVTAKMKIERILFQLQEITKTETNDPKPDAEQIGADKSSDDLAAYQKIYSQFNAKTAIYLSLKLQQDLGGMDTVLDEYLLCLQLDMNLEDYLVDKENYKKEKEEKSVTVTQDAIITLAKIEEKALKKIQQDNKKNAADIKGNDSNNTNLNQEMKVNAPQVNIPKPAIDDIKPKNPTAEIMNEINALNPNQKK